MLRDEVRPAAAAAEELLRRAERLVPAIRARRDEADRIRNVPDATMVELVEADLMRLFQPARWGGHESDPRTFYAIQNLIAQACPSTAWVYGVLSIQSVLLGRQDERLQRDVWGENPRALVCSSFAPAGKAEPVDGGFRLSGRWTFSSGSRFAEWAMVGARIAGAAPSADPLEMNLFLIPRADYEIDDVWNTIGLRGTGSNDLVGADIFVPAYRHIRASATWQNRPGSAAGTALQAMPWIYLSSSTISNFAIGATRGALADFIKLAHQRVSLITGKAAKDDPVVLKAVGRTSAEIDRAQAMYDRQISAFLEYIARDEVIPSAESWLMRSQMSGQLRRLTALVDELVQLQGSQGINVASPVTRTWLDLCAARAHAGNDPSLADQVLGSMLVAAGAT